MDIKEKFIELTSMTYPYGYEDLLTDFLPKGYQTDDDGNYFYKVGDSKIIFACHLDTACKTHSGVTHKFDGKIIRTNGKTILGADDKAGMTILLYMIEKNVPGLYYFFVGEEVGCIGSTAASKRKDFFSNYNIIVSFDRRGTTSIITHQSSRRTCSDDFANSLSKQYSKFGLNLEKDDAGVYTDSAEFSSIIPECTNISVGYYKEHTHDEHQDIEFLENLAKASVLVDWNSLEVKRDPSKTEYKEYNYYGYNYYGGSKNYYGKNTGYYGDGGYKKTRRGGRNNSHMTTKNFKSVDFPLPKYKDEDDYFGKKYKNSSDFYYIDGRKVYYNEIANELKSSGTAFISVDNTIKIDNRHNTDYYKGVRSMFLDDSISAEEFKIIKDQCLNMTDESDVDFCKYMESMLK